MKAAIDNQLQLDEIIDELRDLAAIDFRAAEKSPKKHRGKHAKTV
jgi:hypothetical protein